MIVFYSGFRFPPFWLRNGITKMHCFEASNLNLNLIFFGVSTIFVKYRGLFISLLYPFPLME
uniref:Putative ovule protein n=1 Tax=Solanum chacoense TaxID=4108 RepID=A0A0V0GP76_SOLCH